MQGRRKRLEGTELLMQQAVPHWCEKYHSSSWSSSWVEKMVTPVSTAIIRAPKHTVRAVKEKQEQFVPAQRNWLVIFANFSCEYLENSYLISQAANIIPSWPASDFL